MLAQAPLVISRWIFLQDPDSSGNFPHIQEPPVSLPASHLCVRCHSRVIFPSSTVSLLRNKRTPRSENICWPIISVSVVRGKRGGFYYGKFLQYKNCITPLYSPVIFYFYEFYVSRWSVAHFAILVGTRMGVIFEHEIVSTL